MELLSIQGVNGDVNMNGDKDAADLATDSNRWLVLPLDSDQQEETQDSCCEVSLLFILKLFVSKGAANLAYFNMFKNVSKLSSFESQEEVDGCQQFNEIVYIFWSETIKPLTLCKFMALLKITPLVID